jgi:hypothetical protein
MSIRMMLAAFALALSACAQPAVAPPTAQPEVATKVDWRSAQNAEQCSGIGGQWRPICMMGKPACVVAYKDAGKSCTDSSQCSGRCITGSTGAKPETPTTGICTANSDPCGCFQLVENGKAGYALCAD